MTNKIGLANLARHIFIDSEPCKEEPKPAIWNMAPAYKGIIDDWALKMERREKNRRHF